MCVYPCIIPCFFICLNVNIYVHILQSLYACLLCNIYIYIYVCMYVCMYVCITISWSICVRVSIHQFTSNRISSHMSSHHGWSARELCPLKCAASGINSNDLTLMLFLANRWIDKRKEQIRNNEGTHMITVHLHDLRIRMEDKERIRHGSHKPKKNDGFRLRWHNPKEGRIPAGDSFLVSPKIIPDSEWDHCLHLF